MNMNQAKRGSAIATTVLIIAVLSSAMAALLKFSVTERRINYRHQLRTQASNTAEAVVEYGFARLINKATTPIAVVPITSLDFWKAGPTKRSASEVPW